MQFPSFIASLHTRHEAALEAHQIVFIPSQVFHLESTAGFRCEIRFAQSLGNKPVSTSDSSHDQHSTPDSDPLAPPYAPELLICQSEELHEGADDGYVVLLNKFCVVPRHFLLVTKAYKSQATPPTPRDLSAIYSLLLQAHNSDPASEWISFFNCGSQSGASQPHKHFQFLPVDTGANPLGELFMRSASSKAGDVHNLPALGYAHFVCTIPTNLDTQDEAEITLGTMFMTMLDSMIDHLRHLASQGISTSASSKDLSYNFLMTRTYMVLVPRSREKFSSQSLSVNSLGVCAGMILVKNQDELDQVRQVGIDEVLRAVTVPPLKELVNPCDHA